MFSVVLRPKLTPERMPTLTLALGLATRNVLAHRVDVPVLVKWPNDILAHDKKLAGLLLESQLQRGQVTSVVAGIGVNVQARELPHRLSAVATSLALLGASDLALEPLLVDLLAELQARLAQHESSGLSVMLDELREHDGLRGRRVSVEGVSGTAVGIDEDGALVVADDEGRRCAVKSGSVELL
jgi:BirA family biotin operon repressor/biotin-[acetyl-CoA-carboxylase] ligase